MAYDCFLSIEGVEGETTDELMKKEKAMEIFSFSFGASNPSTIGSGTGGHGGGRVSVSSFNVMKRTDKASTKLFAACCTGNHFDKATVTLRKAGGGVNAKTPAVNYLVYNFEEVYIDSIQWSGSTGGDDYPAESLSISFGKMSVEYNIQDTAGKATNAGSASWDLRANTSEAK